MASVTFKPTGQLKEFLTMSAKDFENLEEEPQNEYFTGEDVEVEAAKTFRVKENFDD